MAVAYIEYCNSRRAQVERPARSHGYEQPHKVKYWCLGNEMDGPWQIGHAAGARVWPQGARHRAAGSRDRSRRAAHRLRLEHTSMPTYLSWDREVLEECYDMVDGISCKLLRQRAEPGGKPERFLAQNLDMERQIHEIIRSRRLRAGPASARQKLLGCRSTSGTSGTARATRNTSTARDSSRRTCSKRSTTSRMRCLTGGFLNTLMRQSERVRVACLAQIVNVIAPLVTNSKGILRQSIYFPYAMVLKYAHGRMLDIQVESETYPIRAAGLRADFARDENVPFLDVVATYDAKEKRVAVFALNRDLSNERELSLKFDDISPSRVLACETVTGNDLKAFNTFESPNKVVTTNLTPPRPAPGCR
jgi:alpha-N-arabinofuranosidase